MMTINLPLHIHRIHRNRRTPRVSGEHDRSTPKHRTFHNPTAAVAVAAPTMVSEVTVDLAVLGVALTNNYWNWLKWNDFWIRWMRRIHLPYTHITSNIILED